MNAMTKIPDDLEEAISAYGRARASEAASYEHGYGRTPKECADARAELKAAIIQYVQESNAQCAQNVGRETRPSQGEAAGILSAGPADTSHRGSDQGTTLAAKVVAWDAARKRFVDHGVLKDAHEVDRLSIEIVVEANDLLASTPLPARLPTALPFGMKSYDLLRRAVRNARPRKELRGGSVRWSVVGDLFALGSTYATHLCRHFGVDPEDMLGKLAECPECGGPHPAAECDNGG